MEDLHEKNQDRQSDELPDDRISLRMHIALYRKKQS